MQIQWLYSVVVFPFSGASKCSKIKKKIFMVKLFSWQLSPYLSVKYLHILNKIHSVWPERPIQIKLIPCTPVTNHSGLEIKLSYISPGYSCFSAAVNSSGLFKDILMITINTRSCLIKKYKDTAETHIMSIKLRMAHEFHLMKVKCLVLRDIYLIVAEWASIAIITILNIMCYFSAVIGFFSANLL